MTQQLAYQPNYKINGKEYLFLLKELIKKDSKEGEFHYFIEEKREF